MAENYVTICGEVADELRPRFGARDGLVQFMGGITTLALGQARIIDTDSKTIEAFSTEEQGLFLPTRRDNGSKRDLDLLVKTTDRDTINQVLQTTQRVVDGRLEVSVFGLRPTSILERQAAHPFGPSAIIAALSDRYYDQAQAQLHKALFPFQVPLAKKTLATWNLVTGDQEIPVPDPTMMLLNYQRSIGGLRPKDRTKWQLALANLEKVYPDSLSQIHDGDFSQLARLGVLIDSLRDDPNSASRLLGFNHLTSEELLTDEAFMLRDRSSRVGQLALSIAQFKAEVIAAVERSNKLTGFWQRRIETHVGSITGTAPNRPAE